MVYAKFVQNNMPILVYIVLFSLLGSLGALVGGLFLLANKTIALKISHLLASFAAGTLLGTAFFDLLPEAVHESEGTGLNIFVFALLGLLIFFFIERFIHWFHHHGEHYEREKEPSSTIPLIIIGDTVHNFIDGIVIAATFMVDFSLGIVTTLAVAAHEIPQEVGDFGLLLSKGMSRKKVLVVNVLSASVSVLGALLVFSLGSVLEGYVPVFLAVTAGFFIYIACSDLIPEIHHEKRRGFAVIESSLLVLGILMIYLMVTFLGHE